MPMSPDSPSPVQKLADWLRYYQDLGITAFFRDRAPFHHYSGRQRTEAPEGEAANLQEHQRARSSVVSQTPAAAGGAAEAALMPQAPSLFQVLESVADDSLERISGDLGECTRCKLHRHRTHIVFGAGNPRAQLMFIGEGPGHDEDLQGLPFVGRAGQLLTQMIAAMGLTREDVYIANVVKCRPPENRTPEKDEVSACMPFLLRQIAAIQPRVIVCLGSCAAQSLLHTNKSISRFRGQWCDFHGARLMATYHPAYLLRNPHAKAEVWSDLKKVMKFLGLSAPLRAKTGR